MWSSCSRCAAFVLLVAAWQCPALAGDLDDCRSVVLEKAEPACSAIINNAARSADERVIAYANRSRVHTVRARQELALADAEAAVRLNPRSVLALLARASARQRMGNLDLALKDLDQALAVDPGNAAIVAARDRIRNAQRGTTVGVATQSSTAPPALGAPAQPAGRAMQPADQQRLSEALGQLNALIAKNPHNEAALRLRAASLLRLNRIAEARVDLDELIGMKPDDASLLALRAITAIGLNQLDQALADADHAITRDPNNATAYLARGMIRRLTGKNQDAVADLDRSIEINANDSSAFAERGQAYMGLGKIDRSLVDFDQAIVLNPLNDLARASRGLALLMKGNNAEGLVDIKNVLDRNPNNQMAQIGQGLAMLVSGQYDRSIVALNQLIGKAAALDSFARLLRARANLGRKDIDSAMADLNSVLGKQPDNADGLLLRGIGWSAKRDYAKALDDLSGALAHRETVEGYFARAQAYEAQNNADKATKDYARATELAPKSVFDVLAQTQSKQKIKLLSKRLPCGSSGRVDAECL